MGKSLYDQGIRYFHLCNTLPTPKGGMSGKVLKPYSLQAIEEFRKWKDVKLIGGGGITSLKDVEDYIQAGADHVSVASMLFNPLNWLKLKNFVEYLEMKNTA